MKITLLEVRLTMMIQDFSSSQYVQNTTTGAIGRVYAVVLSPIGTEDSRGIKRVQVLTDIPGADKNYKGWDWWKLEECLPLVNAPIPTGATVTVSIRRQVVSAVVLSSNPIDVCILLNDGRAGWVSLSRVRAISLPKTVAQTA